ncbi:MAG: dihydrolipoamide dehydrogenase [Candidatus Sumerlaeota bacterium]|nr:dihydrolipoamide dehydrogenase [Candidatus Sumerlaeota bacterium]
MTQSFDLVVIGSGPGGYVAALKAAQLGASVAIVEQHPFFGGTCLNWGCIPSKAILATAELAHRIHHAKNLGISVQGDVAVDWAHVQKRKDKVLAKLRGGIKSLLNARKVTSFQGRGHLDGAGRVVVTGPDGAAKETLTARGIILAVGSVPARLPGWPDDPDFICTSDEALHWKELPKKVLIVGGGVIGCEFACMLQPLGVEVTIVEILPKLLAGLDGSLADAMAAAFKSRGVAVHLGVKVEDVSIIGDGVTARLDNGKTLQVDRVLVATGRRPATTQIGLESAGISPTKRGFIPVRDTMETDAKGVYCIGDANGRCLLAHAASAHGVVAAENILGANNAFHAPIPSCVYTFPEIAAVGLTQEQAREQGIPISIGTFPLAALGKAMAVNETDGFAKVLRHRETDELLGVHMVGHNVTEAIAAAGAMLHQKATVTDVAETVFAHPTISEGIKEAAEDALGAGLHLPPRKLIRIEAGA